MLRRGGYDAWGVVFASKEQAMLFAIEKRPQLKKNEKDADGKSCPAN